MTSKRELDIKSILSRTKLQQSDPQQTFQDSGGEKIQTTSAIMNKLQQIKDRLKTAKETEDKQEETVVNKFMEETKFPKMVSDFMEEIKKKRKEINEGRDFFCKTDFDSESETQLSKTDPTAADIYPGRPSIFRSRQIPAAEIKEAELNQILPFNTKISQLNIPQIPSLADDGIYIGTHKSLKNQTKLINKLFRDQTQGPTWLDSGGHFIQIPNPVRERAFQPLPEQIREDTAQTQYSHNVPNYSKTVESSSKQFSLNIDCNVVKFGHHHLFSEEHVLFQQLCDLYEAYVAFNNKGNVIFCHKRISALKRIISTSKKLSRDSSSEVEKNSITSSILEYYEEIASLRTTINEDSFYERELVKKIIRGWKELKEKRMAQGFTNTPAKLKIKKKIVDQIEDKILWDSAIEEEVEELRDYHEFKFEKENNEYLYLIEVWKSKKDLRAKFRERIAENNKILSTLENVLPSVRQNIQEEISRDKTALAELRKPIQPSEFDLIATRELAEERGRKNRRLPGEEIYSLELTYNQPISSPAIVSANEKQRRAELAKKTIYLKLMVDDVFVCKTTPRPISETFEVSVGSILTVCLNHVPNKIVVEIVESHGVLSSRFLSQIPLSLPESTMTESSAELMSYNFSSLLYISHNHGGVGSNSDYLICGEIMCSTFWTENENGEILAPANITRKLFDKNCYQKEPEITKLMEWAKKARLDPNDVENAEILRLIEAKSRKSTIPSCFRLNIDNFGGFDDSQDKKRFKLLSMRAQDIGQFGSLRLIPAFDSEIQESLLMDKKEEKTGDLNQFEKKQRIIRAYLRLVYENILRNIRKSHKMRAFHQIVQEIELPFTDWSGIAELFQTRRPLRPKRVPRIKGSSDSVEKFTIFVHLRQAYNLPQRLREKSEGKTAIFVEVRFMDKVRRTRGGGGENPSWNEKVEIPLRKEELHLDDRNSLPSNPLLFINVYDKIEISPEIEGGSEKRFNKILLGGLKIPFSSLYANNKIEGKFNIEKPPLQSGYSSQPGASLLNIFITIDPIIDKESFSRTRFNSDESPEILHRADILMNSFLQKFPYRHAVAIVLDMNAKLVFAPRFLHSIVPPKLSGSLSQEQQLARFVSLFPNISDNFLYSGVDDLWSTCDQFISVRLGDEEEHAVLLFNFFKALGKKVFLVAGTAIPDGKTFYVLTEEANSQFVIWNSVTGSSWPADDSSGALKSIGCLMTSNNIYFNIQEGSAPWEITFQTSVTKAWLPFFDSKFPQTNFETVQPSFLTYSEPNESFAEELAQDLSQIIREKITMWRSQFITRWNRTCCRAFLNVIKKLEFDTQIENSLELKNLNRSFIVSGYPFNLSFTAVNAVVDATFAMGMHDIVGNDVEFALAVYVHPYPCDIYSVWVYFGNLIRIYD